VPLDFAPRFLLDEDAAAALAGFSGVCVLDEGLNWKQLWGVRHYLSPHRFVTCYFFWAPLRLGSIDQRFHAHVCTILACSFCCLLDTPF